VIIQPRQRLLPRARAHEMRPDIPGKKRPGLVSAAGRNFEMALNSPNALVNEPFTDSLDLWNGHRK
jgi:hypothetical protein